MERNDFRKDMNDSGATQDSLSRNRVGRFILKSRDTTQTLAADEAIEWLDKNPDVATEILRIHRIHANGQMDLIGIKRETLFTRDALLFVATDVQSARRDYDALFAAAARLPPPCQIGLRLAHAKDNDSAHVVALNFPLACSESVGQWLVAVDFKSTARVESSPDRLADFEMALAQLILSTTLLP